MISPAHLRTGRHRQVCMLGRLPLAPVPVVRDHDYAIRKRYGVWAWPAIMPIDKKRVIRYNHVGECGYEKTQSVIEQLLAEKS